MQSGTEVLRFGLFEITPDGTVLYYKPEGAARGDAGGVLGRNLFSDVVACSNVAKFQELLQSFRHSREPSRTAEFTFLFGQSAAPARLLLARMREQTNGEGHDSIFVHIRKA